MNPLHWWLVVVRARRHERPPGAPSLGRLLLGEIVWAGRQAIHPAKVVGASAAALAMGVLLGPSTPGPVLGSGWRLAISVVVGFAALAVAHRLLQRRPDHAQEPLLVGLRLALAGAAVLVVSVFVLSYLLAAVVGAPPDDRSQSLGAALAIDRSILLGGVLLLVGVIAAAVSDRMRAPAALAFLGVGMAVGDDGLALVRFNDPGLAQSLGVAGLIVVLFHGGLGTSARQLRQGLVPGLALATLGVGITTGVTAIGAMALLDLEPRLAWLLGAIVASTDATAVFAMLRRTHLPERLASVLQVESGANDPVAILLTVGLLAVWDTPPSAPGWLMFGALQLLGGVAAGVVVGLGGAVLLRRLTLGRGLHPVLALAISGVAYGTATTMGASGFLAVYVTGVVLSLQVPRRRSTLRSFTSTLSGGVEVGLFLMLGLLVFPSDLPELAAVSIGLTAILVLLARPIAVALTLTWFDFDWREQAAVGWLGMRGAVPIVLATLAYSAGSPDADLVFDVVFFVVLLSTLVQGLAAPHFLRRLELPPSAPGPRIADVLPLDELPLDIVEVALSSTSALVGRRLDAVGPPPDLLVLAVARGQEVILPRGHTVLRPGDRLVVATPDQLRGRERVESWVHDAPEVAAPEPPA